MGSGELPFQDRPAARDAAIEAAVKQAASDLLAERDAESILGYYASNPTVVSDGVLYPSFDSLAADIKAFYYAKSRHRVIGGKGVWIHGQAPFES